MATISYGETSTSQPDWLQNLYKGLLNTGQAELNKGIPGYSGQLTAGFTPAQVQAGQMIQSQLGNWRPQYQQGLNALQGALGQTQQASQYNPQGFQQFMNPYTTNVVNEIARLGNENLTQNILPGIADQYTSLGQFGSGRQGTALAQAGQRAQREISGAQGQALAQGFGQAQDLYGQWANRGLTGAQQVAGIGGQQLGAAQTGQQLGFNEQQQLFGYGQQQQQTQQNQNTAAYQEWLRQQQQPWANLTSQAKLFGATTAPTTTSVTQTQFKRGGLARAFRGYADGGLIDDDEDPTGISITTDPGKLLAGGPLQLGSAVAPNSLSQNLMNRRLGLADRIQGSLQPVPEVPWQQQLGRGMLEASALGPANWGQLIGRSGSSYFKQEDDRDKINRELEATRLKLEEQALPSASGSGLLGGGTEHFTQYKGKDGSVWAVSNTDPNRRTLVLPGGYQKEIMEQATRAAKDDLAKAHFDNDEQRAAAFQRLVQYHYDRLSKFVSQSGELPTTGAADSGATAGAAPAVATTGAATAVAPAVAPTVPATPPVANPEATTIQRRSIAQRNITEIEKEFALNPNMTAENRAVLEKELEENKRALAGTSQDKLSTVVKPMPSTPVSSQHPIFGTMPKIKGYEQGQTITPGMEQAAKTQEQEEGKNYTEKFLPSIESARGIAESADRLAALNLPYGKTANIKELVGGWLAESPYNTEAGKKLVDEAERIQSARPILEKIRQDVLNAAKGVQTEGDAERALGQFVKLTDTPQAAKELSRVAHATDYIADLSAQYANAYKDTNSGQLRGFREAWNKHRKDNLPMFRISPKSGKQIYINEFIDRAKASGISESDALKMWGKGD